MITPICFTADDIKNFMSYCRSEFPHASVTPKLHMLEEHVVDWLKKWNVGFGLLREQGAENIHSYFNGRRRTYTGIPDWVKRLKHMMAEHLLHVAPQNTTARPSIKRRKKKQRNKRLFTPFHPVATFYPSFIVYTYRLFHISGKKEEQHSNNSNSLTACSENVGWNLEPQKILGLLLHEKDQNTLLSSDSRKKHSDLFSWNLHQNRLQSKRYLATL